MTHVHVTPSNDSDIHHLQVLVKGQLTITICSLEIITEQLLKLSLQSLLSVSLIQHTHRLIDRDRSAVVLVVPVFEREARVKFFVIFECVFERYVFE